MHSLKLIPAFLALAATVSAKTCKDDVKIESLNQVIDCDVVEGDVTVDSQLEGQLIIDGPKQIKGDLIVTNATRLLSLTSTSINSIGGKLSVTDCEKLTAIELSSLRNIANIELITLADLQTLTFGANGVTKANDIEISNTRLNDLSGLKLATVNNLDINNNGRLTTFNSELVNITSTLKITSNGNNIEIVMDKLQSVGEVQLENVKTFDAPSLSTVTQSLKFNKSPNLESFKAPNVTEIKNSLTFIDNKKLTNISFPQLTKLGDMTIQNNTALEEVAGFPKLQTVNDVILRGDFGKVELPKLDTVRGSVTVTSTTDIEAFCGFFDDAKKEGKIEGSEKCSWNNPEANSGGDKGEESDGSSSDENKDDDSAAGSVGVSMAVLSLAAVAGLVQLL
jgi:hypothetical protein